MVLIPLVIMFAALGLFLIWPRPKLVSRRGSIYHRQFKDFCVVEWDCRLFSWRVMYVKAHDTYYKVSCSNLSLAEIERTATVREENALRDLLFYDMLDFQVAEVLDLDRVIIETKCGARFDVELDETGWRFRHTGRADHVLDRLPDELKQYRERSLL